MLAGWHHHLPLAPKPWRPHPQEWVILVHRRLGGGALSHRVWNAVGTCGWWLVFHHLLFTGHLLCPAAVLSQGDTTANKTSPCSWSRRWGLGGLNSSSASSSDTQKAKVSEVSHLCPKSLSSTCYSLSVLSEQTTSSRTLEQSHTQQHGASQRHTVA